MRELPADERLRRLIGAVDRESEAAVPVGAERGDALYRACLGARQVLDARPDGEFVRLRQEPPAPDYAERIVATMEEDEGASGNHGAEALANDVGVALGGFARRIDEIR